jgi:hypothetical protein
VSRKQNGLKNCNKTNQTSSYPHLELDSGKGKLYSFKIPVPAVAACAQIVHLSRSELRELDRINLRERSGSTKPIILGSPF